MENADAAKPSDRPNEEPQRDELQAPLYLELRRLAASQMARESPGQTLQATELVHEAWLRLADSDLPQNSRHFLNTAARTMRRILIDRARRKSRIKHGVTHADLLSPDVSEDQILLIDEAIKRLEQVDPIRAKVVVLKFFGDLSNQEVALELGVTERSVERYWAFAKAWLFREVSQQI